MNERDKQWIQIAANILKTQIKFCQLTYVSLNTKLQAIIWVPIAQHLRVKKLQSLFDI